MNTSEKRHEKKLRLGIEKLGGLCLKLPSTFFAGLPDRLCLMPGALAFFVEAKGEGLQLRPRQLYVAKLLERLGFKVYVANSEALVDELLKATAALYAPKPRVLNEREEKELAELEEARRQIKANLGEEDDLNDADLLRLQELKGAKVLRLTREGWVVQRGDVKLVVTFKDAADPNENKANREAAYAEAKRLAAYL